MGSVATTPEWNDSPFQGYVKEFHLCTRDERHCESNASSPCLAQEHWYSNSGPGLTLDLPGLEFKAENFRPPHLVNYLHMRPAGRLSLKGS